VKAPIILTHSGCKAVFDHPRNMATHHLKALAAAGGVIQINSVYVKGVRQSAEREAAMKALEAKYPEDRKLTAAERQAVLAERRAIDAKYPEVRATFDDVMANLLHALQVAGVDHVGIRLDWDGGGGVTGLEDSRRPAEDHQGAARCGLYRGRYRQDLVGQCPARSGCRRSRGGAREGLAHLRLSARVSGQCL
jgi:microsomal dipeptidase-like Zn-dependent dipeptidase